MNKLEFHIQIYQILKSCEKPLIDASFLEVDNKEETRSKAVNLGIEVEEIQSKSRLRLLTKSIRPKIFPSIDSFLVTKKIENDSDFLIFDDEKVISFIDGDVYEDFALSENFLVTNLKAYWEFLDLLKKYESETDDAFHFVDSFNKDLRKITFISLSENGRLNIYYDLKAPSFDIAKDLRVGFERFKACFDDENKSLLKFLKSAVVSIASNFPSAHRIKMLFESIGDVVDKARINFEVYLNNLSIDKIKKDYDEVKSKYFDSLSDILSKLSQKIIALPIVVSATLFAVDKIHESLFFLGFLLGAIIITSIYISLLLRIHFNDLMYISKVFHYDYEVLLSNNFFRKYPEEKKLFEEIKKRVVDRVLFLKIIIETYYWVMNLANIIIACFILDKLEVPQNGVLFILLALIICLVLFRDYVFFVDEKEKNDV